MTLKEITDSYKDAHTQLVGRKELNPFKYPDTYNKAITQNELNGARVNRAVRMTDNKPERVRKYKKIFKEFANDALFTDLTATMLAQTDLWKGTLYDQDIPEKQIRRARMDRAFRLAQNEYPFNVKEYAKPNKNNLKDRNKETYYVQK